MTTGVIIIIYMNSFKQRESWKLANLIVQKTKAQKEYNKQCIHIFCVHHSCNET